MKITRCLLLVLAVVIATAVEPRLEAGNAFSVYLADDGTVWTWGDNQFGQLGDGTTSLTPRTVPAKIETLPPIIDIAVGWRHTIALDANGRVWMWGDNNAGQRADGIAPGGIIAAPEMIAGLSYVRDVASGAFHCLAIDGNGNARAWGENFNGQCGNGASGGDELTPVTVSGGHQWRALAGGRYHTLGIAGDGTLYAWGGDSEGQLGNTVFFGNSLTPFAVSIPSGMGAVKGIACGMFHSLAVTTKGEAWAWGRNDEGQCGSDASLGVDQQVPIYARASAVVAVGGGYFHSWAVRSNGALGVWGGNSEAQLRKSPSASDPNVNNLFYFRAAAAGPASNHMMVLDGEGGLFTWGDNTDGQLGLGTTSNYSATNNRTLAQWPVDRVSEVALGRYHSQARGSDGRVWSWGSNSVGQSGTGSGLTYSPTAVEVAGLAGIIDIDSGNLASDHSAAAWFRSTPYAWGYGYYGQIGDANNVNRTTPVSVASSLRYTQMAAGGHHSLGLTDDARIRAWGRNNYGQLGNNAYGSDSNSPVAVSNLTDVIQVSAGYFHSIALRSDGTVWAWGLGGQGQLGNGSTTDSAIPVQVDAGTGMTDVIAIAAGGYHNLALTADGRVWAWGYNAQYQLGDGTTSTRSKPVQTYWSGISQMNTTKAIAAGSYHSYCLQNDGDVWSWGYGYYGQLGDGDTANNVDADQLSGTSGTYGIAGGHLSGLFLHADGTVTAVGYNSTYNLGNGTTTNSSTPVTTIPDWLPVVSVDEAGSSLSAGEDGSGNIAIRVVRDGSIAGALQVSYTTSVLSGSGGQGQDFTTTGTVTIPAGQESALVTIAVTNDQIDEFDPEKFRLSLNASAARYRLSPNNKADFEILDNDVAGIAVDAPLLLLTGEDGTSGTFDIVLRTQPTQPVTINISSNNTSEGRVSVTSSSLEFTSSNWNTPQTVTIDGIDDSVDDGDIDYDIITASAVSDDPNYNGINPADVDARNLDNDTAGFFTATDGAPVLEKPLESSNASYVSANTIAVNDVAVTHLQPGMYAEILSGSNLGVGLLRVSSIDTLTNRVTFTTGPLVNDTGFSVAFGHIAFRYLKLATKPTAGVTINFSTNDVGEGSVSPVQLSFDATNWNDWQAVKLFGVDDALDDGDQPYLVKTAAAQSTDANYQGKDPADYSATTVDDDERAILITQSGAGTSVTEGGGNDSYTVSLASQPTGTVTVNLTPNGEVTLSNSSIVFDASTWNNPVTVTVTAFDDAFIDPTDNGSITHSASGADYETGVPDEVLAVTVSDNDAAGYVITPAGTDPLNRMEVGEGGSGLITIRLTASPDPGETVTLDATSLDTGIAALAFDPLTLQFTSSNWNSPASITVSGVDDGASLGDRDVTIQLDLVSSDDADFAVSPADVYVKVLDDDIPYVIISQSDNQTEVTELRDTVTSSHIDTYTVALSEDPGGLVAIEVTAAGSGEEVTVSPATLYFDSSSFGPKTVTVTSVDDAIDEGMDHETIISHAVAASASLLYPIGMSIPVVTATIVDNDSAGINISPLSGLTTTEAGASTTFNVSLTSQPTNTVVIDFTSSQLNDEITLSPISLNFGPGDWNSAKSITVTGYDDYLDDGDRSFTVSGSVNTASTLDDLYDGANLDPVSGINLDNDAIGVTLIENGGSLVVDEDGITTDNYTMVLDAEPTTVVTVSIDADEEILVQPTGAASPTASSAVYFGPAGSTGNGLSAASPRLWSNAITITVSAVDDSSDESEPHTGTITHAASGGAYGTVTIDKLEPSISDNDLASIELTTISGSVREDFGISGFLELVSVNVTSDVDLDGQADFLVQLDPVDLTALGMFDGQLVIFSGGTNDTRQATILDVDDTNDQLTVSGPLVTDPSDSIGRVAYLAGFQVRLASQPLDTVVIDFATSDSTEGFPTPATLVFGADNWDTYQAVRVVGENDDVDDGDQTFSISVTSVRSLDGNYNNNVPASGVTVLNVDDDSRNFILSGAGAEELTTTEGGGTDSFTIALASQPTAQTTVAFSVSATDAAQGSVSPSSVTFTQSNWSTPQTVTVTGLDGDNADNGADPGIAWTVITTNTTVSGDYVGVAIADPSIDNLAINHPPSIDIPPSLALDEDAGATPIELTGIDDGQTGEETQTLTITASSSDLDIIPDPIITYTDGDSTGTLTLTPVDDASGSVVITITVQDSGLTANGGDDTTEVSFTVTVGAVNDAPVVDANGDGTPGNGDTAAFTEGSGPTTIADPALLVSDIDDTTALSASISLASAPDGAAESLEVDLLATGITQSYNSATRTLTLNSASPLPHSDWQNVLRTLRYDNTSGDPDTTDRIVSIVLNDGGSDSAPDTITVSITGVAFRPEIDLDGGGDPIDTAASYDEGDGALIITSPALSVTDPDSPNLSSVTIAFTVADTGLETLAVNTTGTAISQSFVESAGTGTLTLTGPASPTDFQSVLRTLTYTNASEDPTSSARSLVFTATDSSSTTNSPSAILTLSVNPVNDAPSITVTDGGVDDQVAIGTTIAIGNDDIDASDVDDPDSALSFVLLLIPSQGELQLDSGTGFSPLALNGTFTLADLIAGNVRYVHTGLTSADDGFALRVTDGIDSSDLEVFNIDVTGDAPPAVTLSATTTLSWTEDTPPVRWDEFVDVLDADSPHFDTGSLTASIFAGSDGSEELSFNTSLGVAVAGDGTVTVSGVAIGSASGGTGGSNLVVTFDTTDATPGRVQTLLRSLQFRCDSQNPGSTTRTVRVVVNDGSLGGDSAAVDRDIGIVPINDPPVVTLPVAVVVPGIPRTFTLGIVDPEGDSYDVTVDTQPSKGLPLSVDASDQFTYEAITGTTGEDRFFVTVDDIPLADGDSTTVEVIVEISSPGDTGLRVTNNPPMQVEESTPLLFTPVITGQQPGATLQFELVGLATGGGVNFNPADGTLNWSSVPAATEGFHAFGILVTDTTNQEAVYLPFLVAVVPSGSI